VEWLCPRKKRGPRETPSGQKTKKPSTAGRAEKVTVGSAIESVQVLFLEER